jgi:hypothetical protein
MRNGDTKCSSYTHLLLVMQALVVVFKYGLAFCGAAVVFGGCVGDVAGEDFLPKGEAAGWACEGGKLVCIVVGERWLEESVLGGVWAANGGGDMAGWQDGVESSEGVRCGGYMVVSFACGGWVSACAGILDVVATTTRSATSQSSRYIRSSRTIAPML